MILLRFNRHIANRRANCIELLADKNTDLNLYSFTKNYTLGETNSASEVQFIITLNYINTPLHKICCGIIDNNSNFERSANILLAKGTNLEARKNSNLNKQTAYELCLDINRTKCQTNSIFVFEEINVRTKSADIAKNAFITHREKLNNRLSTAMKN